MVATSFLVSDHKPLLKLFGLEEQLPDKTMGRLNGWVLTPMGFNYEIQFKTIMQHANASTLSQLPLAGNR